MFPSPATDRQAGKLLEEAMRDMRQAMPELPPMSKVPDLDDAGLPQRQVQEMCHIVAATGSSLP
jgi:hypothetical protein